MRELILVAVFVLAFVLNLLNIRGASVGIVLVGSALAMVYFYLSVIVFNKIPLKTMFKKQSYKGISTFRIIGSAGAGIVLSQLLVGIIFKTMLWSGANVMLLTGIILSAVCVIVCLIRFFVKRDKFYQRIVIRQSIWLVAGLVLLGLPAYALFDIKYKDYPAYREAAKYSMEHPEDDDARRSYLEEAQKMEQQRNGE